MMMMMMIRIIVIMFMMIVCLEWDQKNMEDTNCLMASSCINSVVIMQVY